MGGSGGEIYTVFDEESESEVENLEQEILHPDLEIKKNKKNIENKKIKAPHTPPSTPFKNPLKAFKGPQLPGAPGGPGDPGDPGDPAPLPHPSPAPLWSGLMPGYRLRAGPSRG